VPSPHGPLTVLEVHHARGQGQKPRVARCGGLERRGQTQVRLNDQPTAVFGTRREVVPRLRAQGCERCGAMATCEVHHIRTRAALSRPGQRAQPRWVRRLAARGRKTLVGCQPCPEAMHRTRPPRHTVTAELTGERRESESFMGSSAGGGGKSPSTGNSPAAYPTARTVATGGMGRHRAAVRLVPTHSQPVGASKPTSRMLTRRNLCGRW
jgi:hypothetical protein